MKKENTSLWDVIEHLQSDDDMAGYLDAAFEDGDASLILAALGDIIQAKGITRISEQTGLSRKSIYQALSPERNLEFSTILQIIHVLGFQLHVIST